jgi:hypothetical protein
MPFYWANVISFDKKFAVLLVHNAYFPLHIFTSYKLTGFLFWDYKLKTKWF